MAVLLIRQGPVELAAVGLPRRALVLTGWGRLMYVIAIIGILRILMDWSTSNVIIREVSQ